MFTVNTQDTIDFNAYDVIPAGKYEVFIEKIEEKTSRNGVNYINLQLRLRNDIEQEFKDRVVFKTIHKNKETGTYPQRMLNTLLVFAGVGEGTQINSLNDLFRLLNRACYKVELKIRTYNGNQSNDVKSFEKTEFQGLRHVFKDKSQSNNSNSDFGQFGVFGDFGNPTSEEIPF